jgi:hypothetical protein
MHLGEMGNGGNDRFCARLGILTILTIGFFVNEHKKGQFEPAGLGKLFEKQFRSSVKVASNLMAHFS